MREPTFEEKIGAKGLKPDECMRLHQHELKVVNMGAKYQERLQGLRERSKEINTDLDKQFKAFKLPYTTKRGRDVALRFVIQLRPEFIQTDTNPKEKAKTRYTGSDDQLTYFFHLTPEKKLDFARVHSPMQGMGIKRFYSNIFFKGDEIKTNIDFSSNDAIVNFMIHELKNATYTKLFKQAYTLASFEEAKTYFQRDPLFADLDPAIARNLITIGLKSVLEKTATANQETSVKNLQKQLETLAQGIIAIPMSLIISKSRQETTVAELISHGRKGNPERVVKDTINATIHNLRHKHKAKKF